MEYHRRISISLLVTGLFTLGFVSMLPACADGDDDDDLTEEPITPIGGDDDDDASPGLGPGSGPGGGDDDDDDGDGDEPPYGPGDFPVPECIDNCY